MGVEEILENLRPYFGTVLGYGLAAFVLFDLVSFGIFQAFRLLNMARKGK